MNIKKTEYFQKVRNLREKLAVISFKDRKKTAAVIAGITLLCVSGSVYIISALKNNEKKSEEGMAQVVTDLMFNDDMAKESRLDNKKEGHQESETMQADEINNQDNSVQLEQDRSDADGIGNEKSEKDNPENFGHGNNSSTQAQLPQQAQSKPAIPDTGKTDNKNDVTDGQSGNKNNNPLSPSQNHANQHDPEPEEDKEEDVADVDDDSVVHIDFNNCDCPYPILTWTIYQGHEGFFTTTAKDNTGESLSMKVELSIKKGKSTPDVIYMGVYNDVGNVIFCY